MTNFKTYLNIYSFDTLEEYMNEEKIVAGDVLLTNQILYDKYIAKYQFNWPVIIIEKYGLGEPTDVMVDEIRAAMPEGYQRIFAIGGGSIMDIGKMLSVEIDKTEKLFLEVQDLKRKCRLITIPTTCGTGSEATNACACEITSLNTKRGLNNDLFFPEKSILIPELLNDLPYKIFATSSIDACVHACESFLSPKASWHSEIFSKEAIKVMLKAYMLVREKGQEHWKDYIKEFLFAANFAGMAFCSAGCAAVHALSYPLGGAYHIPHGEANQLVFQTTFEKYKEKKPVGRINDLERFVGGLMGVPAEDAFSEMFKLLNYILPRKKLCEYNIKETELADFSESVIAGQTRLLNNNYVPLTYEDMLEIYQTIYK